MDAAFVPKLLVVPLFCRQEAVFLVRRSSEKTTAMMTAPRSGVIEASPVEDIEAVFIDDDALESRVRVGPEGR